jgi:hypothetical protein
MLANRQQIRNKQQLNYNHEEWCFLSGPCLDVVTRTVWTNSAIVGYLLDSNDMSTGAEESPLVSSVTWKWLVKADWEGSVCAVVICKVWKLVIVLQLYVVTVCRWSVNTVTNPDPICSHSYMWQLVSEMVGLESHPDTWYEDRCKKL